MFLTEENYQYKIQSYSKQDWRPLLELIPIIEKITKFSEQGQIKYTEDGVMILPHEHPHEIVDQFQYIAYDMPIIIDFDWGSWEEGRIIARDKKNNFETVDIPTKFKLITAITRSDRFCEGALVNAFKSGLILKILKSIEKQIEV